MKHLQNIGLVAVGLLLGAVISGQAARAAGTGAEAVRSPQTVYIDGGEAVLEAYLINDSNYVKLRDIAEKTDAFNVYWDGDVRIETGKAYTGTAPGVGHLYGDPPDGDETPGEDPGYLPGHIPWGFFSFQEVWDSVDKEAPCVLTEGFVNTEPVEQFLPVERAKAEVTVDYNLIQAYFDPEAEMWGIHFFHSLYCGGDQWVYLDGDGVTKLIFFGE